MQIFHIYLSSAILLYNIVSDNLLNYEDDRNGIKILSTAAQNRFSGNTHITRTDLSTVYENSSIHHNFIETAINDHKNRNIAGNIDELWQNKGNTLTGEFTGSTITLSDIAPGINAGEGVPLAVLKLNGQTTETGTGDKSPDNPYIFTGVSSANISVSNGINSPVVYPVTMSQPLWLLSGGITDTEDLVSGERIQRVYKVILNGTESGARNWAVQTDASNDTTIMFASSITALGATNASKRMSSHFNIWTGGGGLNPIRTEEYLIAEGSSLYFRVRRDRLSTQDAAGWRAWLAAHNVTALFELANAVPTAGTPRIIAAHYPNTAITTDKSTITVRYNRDINKAMSNKCDLLFGTFAARPASVSIKTLYISTDKAVGNADRITGNSGGTIWLQI